MSRMTEFMMGFTLAFATMVVYAPAQDQPSVLPPKTVPGALNPGIDQATIQTTICKRGWTATVRPPVDYTDKLKLKLLHAAGLSDSDAKRFELDHLIPLELGGNPYDPRNLWIEPWNGNQGAHVKDQLEDRLNHLVCSGKLSLAAAQHAIASDWIAAYRVYVK